MVYKDTHKTKDGRCWYFRVQINNVPYKSKRYLTKEEAKKEEAIYRLNHKSTNHTLFSVVADAYFENLKTYCKYSTIYTYMKDYNKHIYPYFSQKDIFSINILDYNLWCENMSKNGFTAKYLNKINSLLKNIFQFAVVNYDLPSNPVVKTFKEKSKIQTESKLRYITKEEFDKFISVVDDDMYKLFFEILFYTGARKGELLCLTWNDIDLDRKVIRINKTLYKIHDNAPTTNKTNQVREIYLNDSLVQNIAIYKANRMSFKDFSNEWFVFGDIKTLSTTQIERKKHLYFEKSGVKEITIHEFRHSHVSNMVSLYLKSGNTDSTKFFIMMSQRLGHSIEVMQRTYMHLFPNTQDDIVNMLNKLS